MVVGDLAGDLIAGDGLGRERRDAAAVAPSPAQPFRGICSFSHVPARRIGFSGVPITTLVVLHFVLLLRSPCRRQSF